jgi:glutathione S-transferase
MALQRTFGKAGPIRVKLYRWGAGGRGRLAPLAACGGADSGAPCRPARRDHAAWCPYCHKVWLQLEEKQIPYTMEKINMR